MKYTIKGIDRESGFDTELVVDAETEANARVKGQMKGIEITEVVSNVASVVFDAVAQSPLPKSPLPKSPIKQFGVRCQVCQAGALQKKKVYRMSTPVVIIGYIFLTPSIIGMIIAVMLSFLSVGATVGVAGVAAEEIEAIRTGLSDAGISAYVANKILEGDATEEDFNALNNEQFTIAENAKIEIAGLYLGAGMASAGGTLVAGGFICFGVSCFVSGLLGWLLVMRKKVLQCNQCSAVVTAS